MMARFLATTVLGLSFLLPSGLQAQSGQPTLTEVYSLGVQAYFDGRFQEAHQQLSHAIKQGTRDPRAYYFRGLTNLKLEDAEAARADFQRGGEMEALDRRDLYPVAQSLIRIQGSARLAIEQSRLAGKKDLAALEAERRRVRYETVERRTEEIKRQPLDPTAPAISIDPATLPALPADASSRIVNPFKVDAANLATSEILGGSNARPTPAVRPTVTQPVAGNSNDAFNTTPAAGNPLAGGAGAAPAAADAGNNPFANKPTATPPADNDPFANKPAATPPADNDPFANKPAATPPADNDPLANKPAAAGAPAKKGVFGSLFRAFGSGVGKTVTGDKEDGGGNPAPAGNNPNPFGGNIQPNPAAPNPAPAGKKPADPFGGNNPFDTKPQPGGNAPAGKKPADPFGGNDPFGAKK